MTIEDSIKDALAKMIKERYDTECVEVLSWYDDTHSSGYCETCYYEYAVVVVNYLNENGVSKTYTYSSGFGDLISDLVSYS